MTSQRLAIMVQHDNTDTDTDTDTVNVTFPRNTLLCDEIIGNSLFIDTLSNESPCHVSSSSHEQDKNVCEVCRNEYETLGPPLADGRNVCGYDCSEITFNEIAFNKVVFDRVLEELLRVVPKYE